MLAEKFVPWTEQWKQEGFREALESLRRVLLNTLEARFGPLSEEVRRKVEGIDSFEELAELSVRVGSVSSLDSLGL